MPEGRRPRKKIVKPESRAPHVPLLLGTFGRTAELFLRDYTGPLDAWVDKATQAIVATGGATFNVPYKALLRETLTHINADRDKVNGEEFHAHPAAFIEYLPPEISADRFDRLVVQPFEQAQRPPNLHPTLMYVLVSGCDEDGTPSRSRRSLTLATFDNLDRMQDAGFDANGLMLALAITLRGVASDAAFHKLLPFFNGRLPDPERVKTARGVREIMSEVWLSSEDRHGNHKPGITELTSYVAHQRPVVEELAVATFGHEERGRTIPLSDLLATRVGRTSPHDDRFQAAFETLRNTDNPPDIEDALRFFATHGTTSAQVRIRIGTSTKDTRTLVPEVHDYRAFNPGDFGLGIANDTLE